MESQTNQNSEILALLKILDLGEKQINEGKLKSAEEVFSDLKKYDQ